VTSVLSWDETWMNVAISISKRSKCVQAQYGAVIVTPRNRLVSVGYNGLPANLKQAHSQVSMATCAHDCPRATGSPETRSQCLSVHAECNALLFADRLMVEGGTLYVNGVSCFDCAKLIGNSGLIRVVALDDERPYRDADSIRAFIERCGVKCEVI
jgi:dCMP deaminase